MRANRVLGRQVGCSVRLERQLRSSEAGCVARGLAPAWRVHSVDLVVFHWRIRWARLRVATEVSGSRLPSRKALRNGLGRCCGLSFEKAPKLHPACL